MAETKHMPRISGSNPQSAQTRMQQIPTSSSSSRVARSSDERKAEGFDWRAAIAKRGITKAIDVGANEGGFVTTWLELGAQQVIALEPVPRMFEKLQKRYEGDPRVLCLQAGASDRATVHKNVNVYHCWTLIGDGGHVMGQQQVDRSVGFEDSDPFDLSLITLDELCSHYEFSPDFIKIDTDGYDARVLRGASQTIAKCRPLMMLEVSYMPSFFGDCCECMIRGVLEFGYTIQNVLNGKTFTDVKEFMRDYPWDTSFDVLLLPPSA